MTTDHWGDGAPLDDAEDRYALWDAAYVLGSLSSTERREYENHLNSCPVCRASVSELSGMPALLALLDRDETARADEPPADPPPLRPEVLTSLLAKVSWRRRRTRMLTWTVTAAAAVVLAIGVFVALQPGATLPAPESPRASASAMTMTQVAPSSLDATVTLTSQGWGTHIEMACTYGLASEVSDHHDADDAGDKLAMVAVDRDGNHTQLATWMALSGTTAQPSGSTSMPIDDIVAVQVVSADTGDVLLQRNL
ncbi:MAG: zf-HC2 domain-containing protein [Mycobacterium sp.]